MDGRALLPPYGGYSPNPIVFLAAAAQITRKARMITGAVLPAFNHPLKLTAEIGMLDALSDGRLDVGFTHAFLPHGFARFGVKLDESRARRSMSQLWEPRIRSNAPAAPGAS